MAKVYRHREWRRVMLVVAAVIALAAVVAYFSDKTPRDQSIAAKPSRERQRIAAIVECEMRVQSSLKAPSTATFSSSPDVRDKGGGVAIVISHVDAQNSFGAMLRTRWICEVDVNNPDRPAIHKVALEGQR